MAFAVKSVGAVATALAALFGGRVVVGATEDQLMKYGEQIGYDDLKAYLNAQDSERREYYKQQTIVYFKENKVKHAIAFVIKAPLDAVILKVVTDNNVIPKLFKLVCKIGAYVSEMCSRSLSQLQRLGPHIRDNLEMYFEQIRQLVVGGGIGGIPLVQVVDPRVLMRGFEDGVREVFGYVWRAICALFGVLYDLSSDVYKWLSWEAHKYWFFVLGSMEALNDLLCQAFRVKKASRVLLTEMYIH